MRALPLHAGAGELRDDVARFDRFVVTTDTLVEGVHFLGSDPPETVAHKLVAVNLSDLAAKGALVEGVLLNYPLRDDGWDRAFVDGFGAALARFGAMLLGGDTVRLPDAAPRVLTLTAIGRDAPAPPRWGARAGDALWVTGTIGDAGAGLAIARGAPGPEVLLDRYRRPTPRLAEGRALAPGAHAMSDVSDGLLIDAARMAAVSGLAIMIDLDAVPSSPELRAVAGDDRAARLAAVTAGDDYELIAALPNGATASVAATRVGRFASGAGLTLHDRDGPVPLPARLGYQH